ncbi:hypothetical protein ACIRST_41285 [Kitasatospora sp. NPDC101447]|uniref:hypothetical protein n=1 Tax=Kitasatospora sp. NPDC101447 TaxID=3364102 RepID=UPI0037F78F32
MLKDLGQVGMWLSRLGLGIADLGEETVERFLSDQRRAGRRRLPGPRGMRPLLAYLREAGPVPPPKAEVSPLDDVLEEFRDWITGERGLSPTTMLRYANTARRFLAEQAMLGGVFSPAGLSGADLNMSLLQAGVDTTVIALWLGHAGVRSTDAYVHADMTIKEKALSLTAPVTARPGRYQPTDKVLAFLDRL